MSLDANVYEKGKLMSKKQLLLCKSIAKLMLKIKHGFIGCYIYFLTTSFYFKSNQVPIFRSDSVCTWVISYRVIVV